ncbi:phosphoenolpyruvate phosphomutase-domain-containing protein [Roridomyces roridus]|uniref:Phosphoenolpyruvate phosphomutase-domain-containing protein n=1 Tax=Roridomyces roridus TaxID=1738132 RepID=A0AAD7FWH1_9AGAR|nr:phosphoenolpyruvate phosphomutase-domain-containing protein [Roridomyces roridus]
MDRTQQNLLAQKFAAMHNPKDLPMLCNAFDGGSARALASHPRAKAIASASYSIAISCGSADNDLTLEENLAGVKGIIAAGVNAQPHPKPVTIDLQDGYGSHLERAIEEIIKLGAVGCNIEDFNRETNALWSVEEAAQRVARAKQTAARCGGGAEVGLDAAIKRGKAYLAAGATTVFVWGGGRVVQSAEIKTLVKEFGGLLNVSMQLREGFLNKQEIQALGVARVSMGPGLYTKALNAFSSEADAIL